MSKPKPTIIPLNTAKPVVHLNLDDPKVREQIRRKARKQARQANWDSFRKGA